MIRVYSNHQTASTTMAKFNFGTLTKDLEEKYGKPDILRAIKQRPTFKKEIMKELFIAASNTPPRSRDTLTSLEIYICPEPGGEYFGEEWQIEIKIKEDFLKTLEKDDFINKFQILTKETLKTSGDIPMKIVVAEVQFNLKRFLEKVQSLKETNKKGSYPKFEKRGENYWWIEGKNKYKKINGKNAGFILKRVYGKGGSINLGELFTEMMAGKRNKSIYDLFLPVINAGKEIQRAIHTKWAFTLWPDQKQHAKVVHFNFEKKKKSGGVEPE